MLIGHWGLPDPTGDTRGQGSIRGQCCLLSSPPAFSGLCLTQSLEPHLSPGPQVPCDPVICPQPYLGWLPCSGPSRVRLRGEDLPPELGSRPGCQVSRLLLAGINPASLRGTHTGVWVGVSGSEASEALSRDPETLLGYSMVGCQRAMMANRISFFFDFKGGYPASPSGPLVPPGRLPGARCLCRGLPGRAPTLCSCSRAQRRSGHGLLLQPGGSAERLPGHPPRGVPLRHRGRHQHPAETQHLCAVPEAGHAEPRGQLQVLR